MDISIKLYERPTRFGNPIVEKINQIISSLTGVWFTEDTYKDLMFQDLLCAESDGSYILYSLYKCRGLNFYIINGH